jgi:catechol 2,3-dioxygenase-like lactoylglutathione lyase family enzyme
MIESISHITLIVKDVKRTAAFFQSLFNAEEVYDSSEKNFSTAYEKFFVIGGTWIALMEGEPLSERSYNHIAFKVPEADFDAYVSKLQKFGVEIDPGRTRVEGEGRSIYFYDFDHHLFELHTGTLEKRLSRYAGEKPLQS